MRFGVDVGGTKIEAIALDGSRELARIRVDTPRDDYDGTLAAIRGLVTDLDAACGGKGTVGVGIPGTISQATGLVKNANSVWLIGRPLKGDLERVLARPVRIANDANCFAISEAIDGAAAGARVVFGVIAGTGVGGGIVVDGRVLDGAHGIAGEWGHNPVPWPEPDEWPGPPCYCGKTGCIETFLSGPGLAADFARSAGGQDEGSQAVQPPEIVQLAEKGDAQAGAVLLRYEKRMARALAVIINVLDPDIIVLGGGMSNVARLYTNIPRRWGEYVFARGPEERVRTRLVRPAHGASSGVRGAAWLWNDV